MKQSSKREDWPVAAWMETRLYSECPVSLSCHVALGMLDLYVSAVKVCRWQPASQYTRQSKCFKRIRNLKRWLLGSVPGRWMIRIMPVAGGDDNGCVSHWWERVGEGNPCVVWPQKPEISGTRLAVLDLACSELP